MNIHTIDELDLSAPPGKRLVVLGDPINHSLSPVMHNAALAEMSDTFPELSEWGYAAVHVPAERLPEALSKLHAAGVVGINLTIPHKVHALDLVETVEPSARPMGAVNTLIRTESGYRATNTDGYGITKALEEAFRLNLEGRDIWLFGAGGAARGIVVACLQARCKRLTILNRTAARLDELRDQVMGAKTEGVEKVRFALIDGAPEDMEGNAILINATSLGLNAQDPSPIGMGYLTPGVHVYDTTYGLRNRLAGVCAERGIPYADGLSMLVWQGVRSLEIWTGHPVPAATMKAAALACLEERQADA